jgi:hypothetical protein
VLRSGEQAFAYLLEAGEPANDDGVDEARGRKIDHERGGGAPGDFDKNGVELIRG